MTLPIPRRVAMTAASLCCPGLTQAADRLVFVSSFAGAGKGAKTAFRPSLEDGSLTPLEKAGGIENPFFLAVFRIDGETGTLPPNGTLFGLPMPSGIRILP
jgi:hypothetical protein